MGGGPSKADIALCRIERLEKQQNEIVEVLSERFDGLELLFAKSAGITK